jgi:hypothetical protein
MMMLILLLSLKYILVMHQHIAASKGHEECVLALLKHSCNVHLRGNIKSIERKSLHFMVNIQFSESNNLKTDMLFQILNNVIDLKYLTCFYFLFHFF